MIRGGFGRRAVEPPASVPRFTSFDRFAERIGMPPSPAPAGFGYFPPVESNEKTFSIIIVRFAKQNVPITRA